MKKWRLTISILILTFALAILSFFGLSKYPKNVFWQFARPVGAVLKISFGHVPSFIRNAYEINRVFKQNHDLVIENLTLQSQLDGLKEVSYENEILKKELQFSQVQTPGFTLVPSAIIGQSSGYLKSVTIDKGVKDGAVKGQAVISQGFLVGIIAEARTDNSDVTLVTDYNSLVPVVLQDSRGTGLLRGGLGGLVIEDIPLNIDVKDKESVVTSGLGGQIPQGLAVGNIQEVVSKSGEMFQKVTAITPIDFSQLEVLFVVKK